MRSMKPIIMIVMISHQSQPRLSFHRRVERLRTMRKTTIIACVAILVGLAGCSATEEKPTLTANGDAGAAAETPVVVPEPALEPSPVAEPEVRVTGQYIDAEAILDKLEEIGCKLTDLQVRAVKRGAHFGATCKVEDPLNASVEDL